MVTVVPSTPTEVGGLLNRAIRYRTGNNRRRIRLQGQTDPGKSGRESDPRGGRVLVIPEGRCAARIHQHGQRSGRLASPVSGVIPLHVHRDDGAEPQEGGLAAQRDGLGGEEARDEARFVPVIDPLARRKLDIESPRGLGDEGHEDLVSDPHGIGDRTAPQNRQLGLLVHADGVTQEVRTEFLVEPRVVAIGGQDIGAILRSPGVRIAIGGVGHHRLEGAEVEPSVIGFLVGRARILVRVAGEFVVGRGQVSRLGEDSGDSSAESFEVVRQITAVGNVRPLGEAGIGG